ncbi:hypothetical protein ACWFR1_12075 [Streptomyces sp. NPDC055103]
MTPRPTRHSAPTGVALHPGSLRTGWCANCRAWTRISADLLLLTLGGVTTAGTWAWCEVHDDPDSPLPARRIDRG